MHVPPSFLMASFDPTIGLVSVFAILIIFLGLLLRKMKQPYIVGYILAGTLMGEHGFGVVSNPELIHHLGELGVILLLFFIGMEISLPEFLQRWRFAVVGTLTQVLLSVLLVLGIGYYFDWELARSIVVGFVIALSSSAVIIKLLEDKQLLNTRVGRNVLSVLLTQDIIIVPLLIITSLLGGRSTPTSNILLMVAGGVLVIGILAFIYAKRTIHVPWFGKQIERDHELQVFFAILFCFGGALVTSLFGLSAALGAFVGGMVMHAAQETRWIHDTLHSFRVLFVSFFFISIGLQIDLNFIYENWVVILLGLVSVYLTNHFVNALILRIFSSSWRESILGGALLAQIGELSFLLSFSAYQLGIIGDYGYTFTISLISLTLILSPFWIALTERLLHFQTKAPDAPTVK